MTTLINKMKINYVVLLKCCGIVYASDSPYFLCQGPFENLIKAKKHLTSNHKKEVNTKFCINFRDSEGPQILSLDLGLEICVLNQKATQLQENILICCDDLDPSSTIHLFHGCY